VLVGDFLLARVFESATDDGDLQLMHLLAAAATDMGRAVVLECTMMDIDASEEVYFEVIRGKTATLFSAATAIGACLGGATPEQQQAMYRCGAAFGCAFQLADDLLDLHDAGYETGKPRGADWAQRHATLPLLYALRTAPAKIAEEIRVLWHQEPFTPDHLHNLIYLVETVGGFDYGWEKVKAYREQALADLESIPAGRGRDALCRLCTDAFPLPILPTAV
jgi:octaprenyl-diphosphate synthase